MLRIGITGGIGMGKSTVADYLSRRGEFVIDTDQLARDLVEPGKPALDEIRAVFGTAVFAEDGSLHRNALAQLVFAEDSKRKQLERILHPRIRNEWRLQLEQKASEGFKRATVVIPLLFETGAEQELDVVICVACSAESQMDRLRSRGWTDQQIQARCSAQKPVREKMDLAHRVVWTESSTEISETQVNRIFAAL
jgi:dephospho-CoA kinase